MRVKLLRVMFQWQRGNFFEEHFEARLHNLIPQKVNQEADTSENCTKRTEGSTRREKGKEVGRRSNWLEEKRK